MLELAEQNEKIAAITPAMPSGSSLSLMMNKLPGRVHDVGIAEQHAVTFSAGLATQGLIPYCHIYSSFLQRAYDQIIHDVALQNLHVIFCIDRGGLVGADGATHHGFFDMAFMRSVPNMIVAAPMDEKELRNMLFTAQLEKYRSPISIRYPRSRGIHKDWNQPFTEIEPGKSRLLKEGSDLAILTIGYPGNTVSSVLKKLKSGNFSIAHYDMRFVAPLDSDALHAIFKKFKYIITVEDGILRGGFGSAVIEFMADYGYNAEIRRLGIPDYFVEHGTQDELYRECGYDAEGIELAIREVMVRGEGRGDAETRRSGDGAKDKNRINNSV
jgi:1-deoxy-D-xylulose-5-phosphate synthase